MTDHTSLAPSMTREEWLKISYNPNPPNLSESTRKLLENYSKVPSEDVIKHVTDIRERAFKIFMYPCVGQWRFLNLAIGQHPLYQEVLSRMLTGKEIFLDLGCAFAQDVRRLVADGVDSSKCYGSDLRLEFLDLGYDLFRDRQSLKTHFIEADIFDDKSALKDLQHKVNIINASSFFHLFSHDEQKQIGRRCIGLLSGNKDDLIVGRQVGHKEDGDVPTRDGMGLRYRHNPASWTRMWTELGDEAGIRFEVQAKFIDTPGFMPGQDKARGGETGSLMLVFSVRRIS